MAIEVKHQFVSGKADNPADVAAGNLVPSNWNASHTVVGLGTAAEKDTSYFATAAQGSLADTALQPSAIGATIQSYNANTTVQGVVTLSSLGAAAESALLSTQFGLTTHIAETTTAHGLQSAAFLDASLLATQFGLTTHEALTTAHGLQIATTATPGLVQPDGTTITIDPSGVISAAEVIYTLNVTLTTDVGGTYGNPYKLGTNGESLLNVHAENVDFIFLQIDGTVENISEFYSIVNIGTGAGQIYIGCDDITGALTGAEVLATMPNMTRGFHICFTYLSRYVFRIIYQTPGFANGFLIENAMSYKNSLLSGGYSQLDGYISRNTLSDAEYAWLSGHIAGTVVITGTDTYVVNSNQSGILFVLRDFVGNIEMPVVNGSAQGEFKFLFAGTDNVPNFTYSAEVYLGSYPNLAVGITSHGMPWSPNEITPTVKDTSVLIFYGADYKWLAHVQGFLEWLDGQLAWSKVDKTGASVTDFSDLYNNVANVQVTNVQIDFDPPNVYTLYDSIGATSRGCSWELWSVADYSVGIDMNSTPNEHIVRIKNVGSYVITITSANNPGLVFLPCMLESVTLNPGEYIIIWQVSGFGVQVLNASNPNYILGTTYPIALDRLNIPLGNRMATSASDSANASAIVQAGFSYVVSSEYTVNLTDSIEIGIDATLEVL